MSRVLAPSPAMQAAAPKLVDALEPVYIAETEAEREAVFSFRYSVYTNELMKSDPACAAEILFGLARVLADRQ